jgi:hypothetical protein
MWWFSRKKVKPELNNYQFQFKVVYHCTSGKKISTDLINVVVKAGSKVQARKIIEKVATSRIEIKIFEK